MTIFHTLKITNNYELDSRSFRKGRGDSNDDVIQEGALTNNYGWLQAGGERGVQNDQTTDDVIC